MNHETTTATMMTRTMTAVMNKRREKNEEKHASDSLFSSDVFRYLMLYGHFLHHIYEDQIMISIIPIPCTHSINQSTFRCMLCLPTIFLLRHVCIRVHVCITRCQSLCIDSSMNTYIHPFRCLCSPFNDPDTFSSCNVSC